MAMPTETDTHPSSRRGRIWTQRPDGRMVILEEAMLLPDGQVRSLPCERWVPPDPDHPVRMHYTLHLGAAGTFERQLDMRAGDWLCLRSMRAGDGVLEWVLKPSVQAEFRAQFLHGNRAVDLDGGAVRFEALHAVLRAFPEVASFRRQAAIDEWDALVAHLPQAAAHCGPFEVRFPHVLVTALAALYRADARALSDTLGGAADSLDWMHQEDWSRLQALAALLAPSQALKRYRLLLHFEVESEAATAWEVSSAEICAALAAISRDPNVASRVLFQEGCEQGGAHRQRERN